MKVDKELLKICYSRAIRWDFPNERISRITQEYYHLFNEIKEEMEETKNGTRK